MPFAWRPLDTVQDDETFSLTIRNVMLAGCVLGIAGELGGLLTPSLPPDWLGTGLACLVMGTTALAGHLLAPRWLLGWLLVAVSGAMGWWHARIGRSDPQFLVMNQGVIFMFIAASQALLPLSVYEFLGTVVIYILSLVVSLRIFTRSTGDELVLLALWGGGAAIISAFGIVARARLQEGQRSARAALSQLNEQLESQVQEQVQRIARADLLRRFLPFEVGERLLADESQVAIAHVRREVAILSAVPTGFLESLAPLEAERVAELVNAYVATMSQVAFEHQGVVERVVGPRMTILCGATEDIAPEMAVSGVLALATALQEAANELLVEWERRGLRAVKLRLAIGIAHGPAVVGTFGSERRVDYSALGSAMVRSARLSSEAIPGEIRLDNLAALHVPSSYRLAAAGTIEFAPGQPVACYQVIRQLGSGPPAVESKLEPTPEPGATMAPQQPTLSPTYLRAQEKLVRAQRVEPAPAISFEVQFDGRYQIEALVGRGGMAAVYRAHHVALGERRALKVISPACLGSPDAVEQFRREAEATARIDHPHVVRLHDFGRSLEGHYYLVLDFIEGTSLAEHLDLFGPLPVEVAVSIGYQVLCALGAAHDRGLVHQDLKPSNVMLARRGDALVTDFGLVAASGAAITDSNGGGTPPYMSPEQWQHEARDHRSDLYAWGVLMFEMLSDEYPLYASSPREFAALAVYKEAPRLRERAAHVPEGIADLVDDCLRKKPQDRPASARLAAARLLGELGERPPAQVL
ncbi:MAG TPA: protein kinase, partial [Polyangiaceae bacterium]|nr:protein kinase [Polyangiaceae bacterium]